MTEATELFKNFQHLWQAGKDSCLNLECHAGQVWLHLQVQLHHPPSPQQYHPHPPRQGPSRLRRRARRAEERAKAAANAAPTPSKSTAEVFAQTDEIQTVDAAVQVVMDDHDHLLPNHAPQLVHPFPAQQPPPLHDEVCHDQLYAEQAEVNLRQFSPSHRRNDQDANVPQFDGAMPSPVITDQIWSCKCCRYEQFFQTEDELQLHHNSLDDRGLEHFLPYDECNICYPWHVWI